MAEGEHQRPRQSNEENALFDPWPHRISLLRCSRAPSGPMFLGKWREIAFNGVGDWEPEHQDEANLSSIFQHAPENVFLMMLRWVERKASSGS